MSYAIDANIMLYASDEASPFHHRARGLLASLTTERELVYLAWTTVRAYLRSATHPAIFADPLSPEEAMANVERLLALPHVRVLSEDDGFWGVYRHTTRGCAVRGNLVPDAHLATVLRQHGVARLYTNDADFRKFPFLDVTNPLA